MKKLLPYCLPIAITLIFIVSIYFKLYWLGPLLLPMVCLFNKPIGKFSLIELKRAYSYFHHSKAMSILKTISGFFFIVYNIVMYYFICSMQFETIVFIIITYTSIIINSNFAISLAHDLMHSNQKLDRILATIILLLNGFYYLESDHIYIHHKHVGTRNDPASAYANENLYAYLLRSISNRVVILFGIKHELPQAKLSSIVSGNIWRLVGCISFLIVSLLISFKLFLFILSHFLFVTLIYEVITYIQHFGLRRNTPNVCIEHSWNCYYKLSSYLYFMMPIHSIHHLKDEPNINEIESAGPSYPLSFTQMFMCALVPKLWFAIILPELAKIKTVHS